MQEQKLHERQMNPYLEIGLHTSATYRVQGLHVRLTSLLATKRTGKPIEAFIQTIACCGTRRLNEPLTIAHVVQTKLLRDLCCGHRVWQVLLVCEHEQHC